MIRVRAEVAKSIKIAVEEMLRKKNLCLFFAFVSIFFASCGRSNKVLSVSENELFSLDYGNFAEQINLFKLREGGQVSSSLYMRDGFFYIVNGDAGKIMSLNSYGDLLSLFYSEDFYAQAKFSSIVNTDSGIWKPVSYPFSLTGKIAVDSRKYIYAVGTVPRERNEQDVSQSLLYSQVVLRISSDGKEIDYLGQQGPSGTPFPDIKNIYTTENNEIVVVSSNNDGLAAYWFASSGFLKYRIPVGAKVVPVITPESVNVNAEQSDLFVTVENVVPDCYAERLYVKVDYYFSHIDEESKTQSGIDYVKSSVYPLDIATGKFGEALNIPAYEESVTEDFSKLTYKLPYDFLGVTKNTWMYFIITTENGFNVMMLQPGTQNVMKRNIEINHKNTLYYSLSLSDEGIISALLCEKEKARLVWWRTDSLLDTMFK